MFKGLLLCYAVIIMTFFSVAISGYWAFGNQTKGVILMNFMVDEKPLLPTWVLLSLDDQCSHPLTSSSRQRGKIFIVAS